ncbi:PilZ domain-containing protein [Sphingopyxis sp.]|jgi:hypothetical protein|uniref:PilZ domain-containing protein n=1 Tax=Sphingopyxis sp. TaxID=1908224 RepID=UPI003F73020F
MMDRGNFSYDSGASGPADDNEPKPPDRRSADRYRAVCRIARVRRSDDLGLWRVRNISDAGLMLAADVPVTVGEQIEIALSESITVAGTIVWAEGGRCGVAFSEKIDAETTLRRLAEEQLAEGYRALRLTVASEAVLILREGARPIDLVDISQSGAGFLYHREIEPGTMLDLLLPHGDLRRQALVRWSRGQRGGLWFTQPLDRADLESIARFQG